MMVAATRRPVDKVVYCALPTATTSATVNTIYTATEAVTYSGGVISGIIVGTTTTGTMSYSLQYIQDGNPPTDITPTDNTEWNPEQNILWAGVFRNQSTTAGQIFLPIQSKLKAMRKMKKGDTIQLITDADTNNCAIMSVIVTLFFKQ